MNSTYIWTRETNDPPDFVLQKSKIHGDGNPSPPVGVLGLGQQEGKGSIHFNQAGVFHVIALDAQNTQQEPFFKTTLTVQANPTTTAMNQPTGGSLGQGNDDGSGNNGAQATGTTVAGPSSNSNDPVASTSASCILGALVLLALLGLVLFWLRRREEKRTGPVKSHLDGRGTTVSRAAREGAIDPFTLPQSINRSRNTREKKSMMVLSPVQSSRRFDDHYREGAAGMRVESRRDPQQQDAGAEENMKSEEESVDRPPTYVSR
ncbi:hypothetical protein VKT23_013907 [Stygiomarasmius scandens]|uniref:Uncharacterized protein n=1 Tax=Marasmiellus scandens TaxID=2682957 RepID=A0ABR1J4N6_9AGAR